jgi:hypothetical protein
VYFWRIDHLVSELRGRVLTSGETVAYVLAFLIPNLLLKAVRLPAVSLTWNDSVLQVALALVVGTGILLAYRANGGAGGKDFAGRLLAIGWVLGFRFVVIGTLAFLLGPVIIVAMGAIEPAGSDKVRLVAGIAMFGWALLFFWRLSHHLRRIDGTA